VHLSGQKSDRDQEQRPGYAITGVRGPRGSNPLGPKEPRSYQTKRDALAARPDDVAVELALIGLELRAQSIRRIVAIDLRYGIIAGGVMRVIWGATTASSTPSTPATAWSSRSRSAACRTG
jgi:hypothetical protein